MFPYFRCNVVFGKSRELVVCVCVLETMEFVVCSAVIMITLYVSKIHGTNVISTNSPSRQNVS